LIYLSYKEKFNNIKKKFFQVNLDINQNIQYLENIKYLLDEDYQTELNNLNHDYQIKLRIILYKIQQLENEEVLLKIRVWLFLNYFLFFFFNFKFRLNKLKKNQMIMKIK